MVGADDEAYERGQAGVQAVGLDGGARRRARRGHADEAGAQHVDLHRFRRGVRGDRSWRRPAGIDLQKLGRVVRHSDAQSGGPGRDHGPRRHQAAYARPLRVRHVRPHARSRREGPRAWRWRWARRPEWTCRSPRSRSRTWPPASVCRTAHRARRSEHGRTAQEGPREDERGLRLGDAEHRGRRLLRADRRPPVRHHLDPARAVDARQAAS